MSLPLLVCCIAYPTQMGRNLIPLRELPSTDIQELELMLSGMIKTSNGSSKVVQNHRQ
jgi:hypothetical protein